MKRKTKKKIRKKTSVKNIMRELASTHKDIVKSRSNNPGSLKRPLRGTQAHLRSMLAQKYSKSPDFMKALGSPSTYSRTNIKSTISNLGKAMKKLKH